MFFWEVIFEDCKGQHCSVYSLKGYDTEREAIEALYDADEQINLMLDERGCSRLLDEQVVFKNAKSLY